MQESFRRNDSFTPAILIYLACAITLAYPWLSGRVTIPWDAKAHFFPQLQFLAHSLKSGDSPFWTPNVFAGSPQIADPQSLIFSPPFLLLALLNPDPSFRAADATVFLMLALSGVATLLIFRDRSWHPAGAIVAALAVSFGGSSAWRIQHIGEILSLAWFIFAMLFLSRGLKNPSLRLGCLAGIFAGFMVLGRDQVAFLGTIFLSAYVIACLIFGTERYTRIKSCAPMLSAGLFCGICLVGIPLALTYSFASDSNRLAIDLAGAERGSLHPSAFLTLFVPNLYGTDGPIANFWGAPSIGWGPTDLFLARNMSNLYIGALPILAFIIGCARPAQLGKSGWLLLIASGAALVYALGRYTPVFQFLFLIPGAGLFRRPADATFFICAFMALLSGYFIHRLINSPGPTNAQVIGNAPLIFLGFVFCGAVGLSYCKDQVISASVPILLAAGFLSVAWLALFIVLRQGSAVSFRFQLLIAAVMTLDLAVNNGPNESTALPPAAYDALRVDSLNPTIQLLKSKLREHQAPDRRDRVELAAIGFEWPNASLSHGFEHDLGYNPLRLKLFNDATGAQDHVAVADQRTFSKLAPSYRSPLYALLGLKFIATGVPIKQIDSAAENNDFPLVARTADAFIYENRTALPRVMTVLRAQRADFSAMLREGIWPKVNFRDVVLIEDGGPQPTADYQSQSSDREARILQYKNAKIVIEANAPNGGFLVLNDVWQSWWYADVDGMPATVLRANVMFRAVPLPPGRHIVSFRFRPVKGAFEDLSKMFRIRLKAWFSRTSESRMNYDSIARLRD